MLFSIITPVYNRENSIAVSVDSVLSQTCPHWELLLVNDGSTDATAEICKEYAQKDSRIRYIHKDNGGVSSARNRGMEEATGEYIVFLDSDDQLLPQALETIAGHIAARPQVDFFCFGFGEWLPKDSEGKCMLEKQDLRRRYIPTHLNVRPQTQDFLENYVWNKCFRTVFLSENGLRFDETRRNQEDGIFVVNCLDAASRVGLITESLRCADAAAGVEHLSAKAYKEQLTQYVGDETAFQARFADVCDFTAAHYCRSNFNVLNVLCGRIIREYGKTAKDAVEHVLKEPIVVRWTMNITPADNFEKMFCDYVQNGKTEAVFSLYHAGFWRRVFRKLRCLMKR